jgi:DNA-binding transcriptional regulator YiaG
MSVNEILQEMDRLSPNELKVIREKLDLLHQDFEATPEMLAAIEEGRRSLREEGGIPIEDAIKEVESWNTKSF